MNEHAMPEPMYLLAMTRDPVDERQKTVRRIRELASAEREIFKTSSQHLSEFESWDALMRIVRENHAAYHTATQECRASARAAHKRGRFRPLFDLTINRALINLVATFRLYLDHTETRFKHRFGESSPEVGTFKAAAADAFNRSFAYRFIYSLRNYTLHAGMPVVHTTFNAAAGPDRSRNRYELSYYFDPVHLLATGPSYCRGQVKQDLVSRTSPFPVEPLLDEAFDELSGIHQRIVAAELPHLHRGASAIMNILSEAIGPERVAILGHYEPSENGMKARFYDIPWVMLERLGYLGPLSE